MLSIERTGTYRGLYHVLLGAIAPLDGLGPELLKIDELLARLTEGAIQEVIIATDADKDGEITSAYLFKLLRPRRIKLRRHGIEQVPVVRGPRDALMELLVQPHQLPKVTRLDDALVAIKGFPDRRRLLEARQLGGERRALDLDDDPRLEDLLELEDVEVGDRGPDARPPVDEALEIQPEQGVPDRRPPRLVLAVSSSRPPGGCAPAMMSSSSRW